MRRALVTRPSLDARALGASLRQMGWTPLYCPMLRIEFLQTAAPRLPKNASLALTSANGARALALMLKGARLASDWKAARVFAVGEATAAAAKRAGLTDIVCGEGDALALARLIARHRAPHIVHITSRTPRANFAAALRQRSIRVTTHKMYEAHAARALPPRAVSALRRGALDAALFFSERTAAAFARLVRTHPAPQEKKEIRATLARTPALCLAPPPAVALAQLMPVTIARRPRTAALLNELVRLR